MRKRNLWKAAGIMAAGVLTVSMAGGETARVYASETKIAASADRETGKEKDEKSKTVTPVLLLDKDGKPVIGPDGKPVYVTPTPAKEADAKPVPDASGAESKEQLFQSGRSLPSRSRSRKRRRARALLRKWKPGLLQKRFLPHRKSHLLKIRRITSWKNPVITVQRQRAIWKNMQILPRQRALRKRIRRLRLTRVRQIVSLPTWQRSPELLRF